MDQVYILRTIIYSRKWIKMYVLFINIEKFFNVMNNRVIRKILSLRGILEKYIRIIKAL